METKLEYATRLRRELHQYPEIGFNLPKTLALVRRELDAMGIPYTEEFGKSSIVGTINPECKGFTIGIRGDMDALPMQEADLTKPYASKIPGQMHACGHDAHTAILLATARELKAREKELTCRVKLLFTPAEEYIEPGCEKMVQDGVMDDIDCAVACHVLPDLDVGRIKVRTGGNNANSMGFTIEFFGKASHAADQHKGKDAIAMAVEAYTAMEIMVAKEFKAKDPRVFNVGVFSGGFTNNIICDYCKLFCTSRTHDDGVTQKILDRCTEICQGIAAMNGGEAKVTVNKLLPYVHNDPIVAERIRAAAGKVLGEENVLEKDRGLGGEDFAFFSRVKPCTMFSLGSGSSPETKIPVHNVHMDIDERCMQVAVDVFVQFVMDNMNGIDLEEVKL